MLTLEIVERAAHAVVAAMNAEGTATPDSALTVEQAMDALIKRLRRYVAVHFESERTGEDPGLN